MQEDLLTRPQKFFIGAVLVLAEEALVKIKNLAQQQTEEHRLYIVENSIPEDYRAKIVMSADEALKQIEELANVLEIDKKTYDVRKKIVTYLLGIEDDFSDLRPHKLKGYGEVSPKLAQILEPWLAEFHKSIKSVLEILRASARKDTSQDQQ